MPNMMFRCYILVCLLLSGTALAQQTSVTDVLEKNGYTRFVMLLKRVGAYDAAKKQFTGTVLAPTDVAVDSFLKDVGLTLEDASKRPQLLDALLSYHIIPHVKGSGDKMVAGKPVIAGTANPVNTLRLTKDTKGAIQVQDMQGKVAKIVAPNMDAGRAVVHGIDRVLLTDRIYSGIGAVTPAGSKPAVGGRRLLSLQRRDPWSRNTDDLFNRSTYATDVTSAAIEAAAKGNIPVRYATTVGRVVGNQVSSIPAYRCWNCYGSGYGWGGWGWRG